MPTTTRRFALRLVAVSLAATALGACSLLPPEAVPAGLNPVIVVYQTEGGECPAGPCGFRAEIRRDGRVIRSDGIAQTVEEAELERLIGEVAAADWKAILAKPFTGECPKNFDGHEAIYTFHSGAGLVTVAGCRVEIDPQQEPFKTVERILFAVGG